ncbi:MAG: hypothetical protein JRI68_02025 [Deltaproteobacteria bacterium]|nr:hypothetical protein [Deltaproteobacteria bacterium]
MQAQTDQPGTIKPRRPAARQPASRCGLVVALAASWVSLVGCRDDVPRGRATTSVGPTQGATQGTGSASSRASTSAAAPLAGAPTGFERPVQLVYELDVRRLPREWQPFGATEAATRLASRLRQLLRQRGLVGRAGVQLEPAPTVRLSFHDLLPAEQDALTAEIEGQREATLSPLGSLRLFREHLGKDPIRVAEACQRRATELSLTATEARPFCAAWAAIPDASRQCVASRDVWGRAKRCTEPGREPTGALVAAALPCLEAHAAEAHVALHGGLVALVDLTQADPPDAAALTAALRKGLGKQAPPCTVTVTGRNNVYRLRVVVASLADTKRDLKAFEQSLGDWLAPGSAHRLTFRAVHWVGPSVSRHALGQYCEALRRLPQGLAGCLSHPEVRALCDARGAVQGAERPSASTSPPQPAPDDARGSPPK